MGLGVSQYSLQYSGLSPASLRSIVTGERNIWRARRDSNPQPTGSNRGIRGYSPSTGLSVTWGWTDPSGQPRTPASWCTRWCTDQILHGQVRAPEADVDRLEVAGPALVGDSLLEAALAGHGPSAEILTGWPWPGVGGDLS